jgi:hypothetical protein
VEKAVSVTHSECVFVAFVIQHAVRKRLDILSPLACSALQQYSTISHKQHDYREKVTKHALSVMIFSTIFA